MNTTQADTVPAGDEARDARPASVQSSEFFGSDLNRRPGGRW